MKEKTIVISCAGMGLRLGAGMPKCLIDVAGKPLIIRQLECLDECDDVRVVVGFQAERVIETVQRYRRDVLFAFNPNYKTTGTAASFSIGMRQSPPLKFTVALDGDLLVHPEDFSAFLLEDRQLVGGCAPGTDNPVLMTLDDKDCVVKFSRDTGSLEWTGLAQIFSNRLEKGTGHVYQLLEPLMPLKVMKIRTREIDTENDYNNAVRWIQNNYKD